MFHYSENKNKRDRFSISKYFDKKKSFAIIYTVDMSGMENDMGMIFMQNSFTNTHFPV